MASSGRAEAPGLARRLAAILYDSLLVIALLIVATALILPLTRGHAIAPGNLWYQGYVLLVAFAFFGGCWTLRGQTLGMLAWRLRIERRDGGPVRWRDALIRFAAALLSWTVLGLGFLWVLVDRQRLAWHDHLSRTHLVKSGSEQKYGT